MTLITADNSQLRSDCFTLSEDSRVFYDNSDYSFLQNQPLSDVRIDALMTYPRSLSTHNDGTNSSRPKSRKDTVLLEKGYNKELKAWSSISFAEFPFPVRYCKTFDEHPISYVLSHSGIGLNYVVVATIGNVIVVSVPPYQRHSFNPALKCHLLDSFEECLSYPEAAESISPLVFYLVSSSAIRSFHKTGIDLVGRDFVATSSIHVIEESTYRSNSQEQLYQLDLMDLNNDGIEDETTVEVRAITEELKLLSDDLNQVWVNQTLPNFRLTLESSSVGLVIEEMIPKVISVIEDYFS
ncbi:hypothetical protein Tco_1194436 [Tanacetum coccineum]|uniref:Uncharacterized protein n=1 Tax=Tanacetum coccineum TaxID=301880 RepID=A0ABQ5HIU6_9ASTR